MIIVIIPMGNFKIKMAAIIYINILLYLDVPVDSYRSYQYSEIKKRTNFAELKPADSY